MLTVVQQGEVPQRDDGAVNTYHDLANTKVSQDGLEWTIFMFQPKTGFQYY